MPRTPSQPFVEQANAEANEPTWLYRVNVSDTPEEEGEGDLFLTNDSLPVEFFRTDNEIDSPQEYTPFPIKHSGIGSNTEGQIDTIQITVSNISREIQAFIENRNALRGRKVTIRQVFRAELDDPDAYIEEEYYIDSASASAQSAVFTASSKLDVLNVRIPRRMYLRNYCQWQYKGLGCWKEDDDGGFDAPDGFSLSDYHVHAPEVSGSDTAVAVAEARFHEMALRGYNKALDTLFLSLKLTDRSQFVGQQGGIEVSSSGAPSDQMMRYEVDLSTLVPDNSYHAISVPLSAFTTLVGGSFNPAKFSYIRVFGFVASGTAAIAWKDATFRTQRGDSCNKRLADCRRHNNVKRYGGFPGIPDARTFRG